MRTYALQYMRSVELPEVSDILHEQKGKISLSATLNTSWRDWNLNSFCLWINDLNALGLCSVCSARKAVCRFIPVIKLYNKSCIPKNVEFLQRQRKVQDLACALHSGRRWPYCSHFPSRASGHLRLSQPSSTPHHNPVQHMRQAGDVTVAEI